MHFICVATYVAIFALLHGYDLSFPFAHYAIHWAENPAAGIARPVKSEKRKGVQKFYSPKRRRRISLYAPLNISQIPAEAILVKLFPCFLRPKNGRYPG